MSTFKVVLLIIGIVFTGLWVIHLAFGQGDQERGGDPSAGGAGSGAIKITRGFCLVCDGGNHSSPSGPAPQGGLSPGGHGEY